MDCKNEEVDFKIPKNDLLVPKVEQIEEDFIKKEYFEEEEIFVTSGIVEVDQDSIKKEVFENYEIESCSSSNV